MTRLLTVVLTTSLVLVGVAYLVGTLPVPRVFAGGLPWGTHGGPFWARGADLPFPRLDGAPFTVAVTPGTVSQASATSLTVTANDGSSRTFALDDKTAIHGKAGADQAQPRTLVAGDKVVVVVLDNAPAATAVLSGVDAAHNGGPPWGRGGWWH
jgi:hypothetical protein